MRQAQTAGQEALKAEDMPRARRFLHAAIKLAKGESLPHIEAGALGDLGWLHVLVGEFEEGIRLLRKAHNIAVQIEEFCSAIIHAANLGFAYSRIGLQADSIKQLDATIELARAQNETEIEFHILRENGVWFKTRKEWQPALQYLEQALPLAELIGDQYQLANLLFDIGKINRELGNFEISLQHRLRAWFLLVNSGASPDEIAGRLAPIIGLYENNLNNPEKAVEMCEIGMAYAFKGNNPLHNIAEFQKLHQRIFKSVADPAKIRYPVYTALLEKFDEDRTHVLLDIAAKTIGFPQQIYSPRSFSRILEVLQGGIPQAIGAVMGASARHNNKQGNVAETISLLKEAEKIAKGIGDNRWLLDLICQRGSVLHGAKRYTEAVKLYREAERIGLMAGNGIALMQLYHELGMSLLEIGDIDESHSVLVRALDMAREEGQTLIEAQSHFFLAVLAKVQGDLETSAVHLSAGAELFLQIGEVQEALRLYIILGEQELASGRFAAAHKHFSAAEDILNQQTPEEMRIRLKANLSRNRNSLNKEKTNYNA
jgi:tetratricopeptide (TPR) repeat protein